MYSLDPPTFCRGNILRSGRVSFFVKPNRLEYRNDYKNKTKPGVDPDLNGCVCYGMGLQPTKPKQRPATRKNGIADDWHGHDGQTVVANEQQACNPKRK